MKKKILITGIDGYIGSVMEAVLQKDYDITGLDAGFYSMSRLYHQNCYLSKRLVKDVRDVTLEDLDDMYAVIHLAELSNDPLGDLNPMLTKSINVQGSLKLATLAREAGVKRFIYSSSCAVYGASDEIKTEKSSVNPQTLYAKCKLINEANIAKLACGSFTPTFMRNATAFGLSPSMRFDLSVNDISGQSVINSKIKLNSTGAAWRPFTHVNDISNAFKTVMEAPAREVFNEVFNVGSNDSNYRTMEIVDLVMKYNRNCKILKGKVFDFRNYRINANKIKNILGFKCEYSVPKGINILINKFNIVNLTAEQHQYRVYRRINQIKYLIDTNQVSKKLYWR